MSKTEEADAQTQVQAQADIPPFEGPHQALQLNMIDANAQTQVQAQIGFPPFEGPYHAQQMSMNVATENHRHNFMSQAQAGNPPSEGPQYDEGGMNLSKLILMLPPFCFVILVGLIFAINTLNGGKPVKMPVDDLIMSPLIIFFLLIVGVFCGSLCSILCGLYFPRLAKSYECMTLLLFVLAFVDMVFMIVHIKYIWVVISCCIVTFILPLVVLLPTLPAQIMGYSKVISQVVQLMTSAVNSFSLMVGRR